MSARNQTREKVYKVVFANQGKICEIYARNVSHGALLGFVEVEGILFGERSQVVVDPSEESLKVEFDGVRRSYLPVHAVIRIDEVEKQGTARITGDAREGAGNVASFPIPVFTPKGDPKKS